MPIFDITFRVIYPELTGEFLTEWGNCLKQILSLEDNGKNRIIKIDLFVHSSNSGDFLKKKRRISADLISSSGAAFPSPGILPTSPEKPFQIVAEINLIGTAGVMLNYREFGSWRYVVAEKDGCRKLWISGIGETTPGISTADAAKNAFDTLKQILDNEKMSFDHIIRQWNYIGDLLRVEEKDHSHIQRYQAFNEVRHQYYSRYRSVSGYPAATGIGMNYDGVLIDVIALAPCPAIHVASISNPSQINPSEYGESVLEGDPVQRNIRKHPPAFDRAKLLCSGQKAVLFVSGTASITGQKTVGPGDIREQLNVTIDNIRVLTGIGNIRNHCKHYESANGLKYKRIRVYIKNEQDFAYVRSVCESHFGEIPAVYLRADICRDALLVEIEAQLRT